MQSLLKFKKNNFSQFFVGANPAAMDLLDKLLHLDPDRQPSAADEALYSIPVLQLAVWE